MLNRRFPVALMKGILGFCLAILLVAPVAVLWSSGSAPADGKGRQAVGRPFTLQSGQTPGAQYPDSAIAQEVAWKERASKPLYSRPAGAWDNAVLGNPRFGDVSVVDLDADDTLVLPFNKGSFRTGHGAAPEIAAALKKDINGPARANGDYFIVQLNASEIRGKDSASVRKSLAGLGSIEILDYVPNNAYLVRARGNAKQSLLSSPLFQYVTPYHPAFKISPSVGVQRLRSPQRAASDDLNLIVRLHQRENPATVVTEIQRLGGSVDYRTVIEDRPVLAVTLNKLNLDKLARIDAVQSIVEKGDLETMDLVTSVQSEVGRFMDPRLSGGKFIRPFYNEGIDGGGQYVTDPNQIVGCTPFDPATGLVDPNCYLIQPQLVGLVDNGLSLDSAAMAYSRTNACGNFIGGDTTCGSLSSGVGVGSTHRKVEMYVTARDINLNGTNEDTTASGDFLSCDSISSGGDTHGQIVAGTMLGNPSGGQFGLGFLFTDVDVSNQFFSYFNDSSEKDFPMDGQASGAKVLFIDAQGTGVSNGGPPPCATNFLSDVDAGVSVADDVAALVYRRDLDPNMFVDPNGVLITTFNTIHPRGAKIVVLPFGAPFNFDNNIHDGHNTYSGDPSDIDAFLFKNRRVAVVIPVGNDGSNDSGSDIDPFVNVCDPNIGFSACDVQVNSLASGKNVITVGSNNTDTIGLGLTSTDNTEFINNFTSKGPSTFASRRIAPLVVAPGFEQQFGTGTAREGDYAGDFYTSHAAIVSFDDDQTAVNNGVEVVRNQGKKGTSLSAGKVGGVLAQINDYFAKGYYPAGVRSSGPSRLDTSGMLAKAITVASADFAQSGPLIASCQNKFCIEQGYGKVELANVLPLKTYPATRRPADLSNLSNQPDVPNNILVADELWNGGQGFGVVAQGGIKEFTFIVNHGGNSVRAALAWYDTAGETLINDLNLEVVDGDYDKTSGYPPFGSGSCNNSFNGVYGIPPGYECNYCTIASLPNPDGAYYDPTANNPYVRRYLGNHFTDRQQFSLAATCDIGTGALDPNVLASRPDGGMTGNTTEMVYLYSVQNQAHIPLVTANTGTGSDGFYKAVVSWPTNALAKGAPNVPCVMGTPTLHTTAGGNDVVLSTRDGVAYIGSGPDDPNTLLVDEARCDTTAAGGDTQVCPNGQICQPFGLVVTGPITTGVGKAQVELDKQAYDCSDTQLKMRVIEDETSTSTITAKISANSRIEVVDPNGTVVDTEAGMSFNRCSSAGAGFRPWRAMCNETSVSAGSTTGNVRVQYIGDLGRVPIANNGLVEVEDGCTIRAVYADPDAGDPVVSTSSPVRCKPLIGDAFVLLTVENAKRKFITGGCDLGRFVGGRGDFFLDSKERLQYQVFFTNHSPSEIVDLRATLTCINPVGTTQNPCQWITIVDPVQHLGRIPFSREGAAVWNLKIAENVKDLNVLNTANRIVDFKVTFTANNTDLGGQIGTQSFTFREAVQADNERLFYSSDAPLGGLRYADYNQNGQIDPAELANGGRREEREIRLYQDWTAGACTPNADPNILIKTCTAGQLGKICLVNSDCFNPNRPMAIASGACGANPCTPFNFDLNDGSFTEKLAADSKPGGYPTGTQGWWWGTGGACGWQTRNGSALGVWHAGAGPIGTWPSASCGSYAIPSDSTTQQGVEFVTEHLTSPIFHKVNTGTDARGFSFDARMESLAFNSNEQVTNNRVTMRIEIDTNIDDDGPVILSDSYTYRAPYNVGATLLTSINGARQFGPKFDPDNSLPTLSGNEVGISGPLAAYDAGNLFQRPFLPYPAVDGDTSSPLTFDSDERLSAGIGNPPCATVQLNQPCRVSGFTTAAGPVRNRDIDTGASFEDFNGASGNRFQFQFNWIVREGGTAATGWTVDDVVFEWSEQHPVDPTVFTGGDCSLDNLGGLACGPIPANTCIGGPRNGLFCSTVTDCRDVVVEGTCVGLKCTTGRVGITCGNNNDCDLGRCVAGNTELGCSVDADCNLNTSSCDAIPFRISPTTNLGASGVAKECALINFEHLFTYDCTSSIQVTVADDTPSLCGAGQGCTTSPRQVLVNARSANEALGENFKLTQISTDPNNPNFNVFQGTVLTSAVNDQPGILFMDSDPGERFNLVVSYNDPECDSDRDGTVGETDFTDIDGDGVKNFGADGVGGDQDSGKKYCGSVTFDPTGITVTNSCVTGAPISDDDNCFDRVNVVDTFNPAGVAQLDNNGDGTINAADCPIDPNHNKTGQCDFDNDGIGDICDNCPTRANSDQLDTDNDGIGNVCEENDIDHDLVNNVADNCPTVYNPGQAQSGGGGKGGGRFNRGTLCDNGSDIDGDGVAEVTDNCPNEQLIENPAGGFTPGPCPGGTLTCTYNPDQRDTDQDGIGDVCDAEDLDRDGVVNNLDNCPTIYNPADPTFQFQTDSDGDGAGDDRAGKDAVGRCQGGPTPGKQCLPINTGSICGSLGFCVQSADAYCDPDSQDDNNNGTPDDLTQFTTEIDCNYIPSGLSNANPVQPEVAALAIGSVLITDDGTADFVCVSGDPNPNNNPAVTEDCPDRNLNDRRATIGVTGTAADLSCQSPDPNQVVATPNCEPVPDGIVDPAEVGSVQITVANQTVNALNAPRTLTNAVMGIRSLSASVGCVIKGQVFMGTISTLATTPPGALQFIWSPTTGQSTPAKLTEAEFVLTLNADGIEANSPDQTFKLTGDVDQQNFPLIAAKCGGAGTALGALHSLPGVLCEDFDTDRNSNLTFEWSRLYPTTSGVGCPTATLADPLRGCEDPNDDVLGSSVDGGSVPLGVDGRICSSDTGFAAARATCHVVSTENDWHMHSKFEGCQSSYTSDPGFSGQCAPKEFAHSGFRSLHMGRHLDPGSTLGDTYRFRQTSAFVMDPVNLGTASQMEFWMIIQVCDDKCVGIGNPNTDAGGQVQLSLLDNATGLFLPWQRLAPTQNGYNSLDQEAFTICEFDPGDDQFPGTNETMCGGQPQWSDLGDFYGSDRTCTVDQDGNDLLDKDCGQTTNRTVVTTCSWVTNPTCGSFLENGSAQAPGGVWARSQFDLTAFSGREARLRWIFEGGGGWSFGESRSFLEPSGTAPPSQLYDSDEGWYVDDIRISDLRTNASILLPDPDDGLASCPSQGDPNNCSTINVVITGSAVDATAGDTVLFAQSSEVGTQVSLDARQTTALLPGACSAGVLEYQWSRLSDHLGSVVEVLSPFSPKANVNTALSADATYRVDVRCSSDLGCTNTKEVNVLVYSGDDNDMASEVHNHSPIGFLDGVVVDHDPNTNIATLSWRARPQPSNVSGFDVFKRAQTSIGQDVFASDKFQGTCFANAVPNGAVGTRVTRTDSTMPAMGNASLYMVGHSSNNTLAIAPLGRRPSASNRAGTLISANVTCP